MFEINSEEAPAALASTSRRMNYAAIRYLHVDVFVVEAAAPRIAAGQLGRPGCIFGVVLAWELELRIDL